eukprot:1149883-Pelagomonas_calceolata.AAC.2
MHQQLESTNPGNRSISIGSPPTQCNRKAVDTLCPASDQCVIRCNKGRLAGHPGAPVSPSFDAELCQGAPPCSHRLLCDSSKLMSSSRGLRVLWANAQPAPAQPTPAPSPPPAAAPATAAAGAAGADSAVAPAQPLAVYASTAAVPAA